MKVKVTLTSEKEEIKELNLPVTAKRLEKTPFPITIGNIVIVNELKNAEGELKEPVPFMVHRLLHDINHIEIQLGDPLCLEFKEPDLTTFSGDSIKDVIRVLQDLKNEIEKSNAEEFELRESEIKTTDQVPPLAEEQVLKTE